MRNRSRTFLLVGAMLAGVDYLASDVLGRKGASTILFVLFVGPALLLTPVWSAVGTRIGKKRGYLISSVILAVGAVFTGVTVRLTVTVLPVLTPPLAVPPSSLT